MAYSNDWDGLLVPAYCPSDGAAGSTSLGTGLLRSYLGYDKNSTWYISARQLPPAICPSSPRRFGFGHNTSMGLWNNAGAAPPSQRFFRHLSSVKNRLLSLPIAPRTPSSTTAAMSRIVRPRELA